MTPLPPNDSLYSLQPIGPSSVLILEAIEVALSCVGVQAFEPVIFMVRLPHAIAEMLSTA